MKKKLIIFGLFSVLAIAGGITYAYKARRADLKPVSSTQGVGVPKEEKVVEKPDCSQEAIIKAINEERAKVGVKPVVFNQLLDSFANDRAIEQNGIQDNHTGFQKKLDNFTHMSYRWVGEDQLHTGCVDPSKMLTRFKASTPHWKSLMNPKYDEIGVGYYKDVLNINLGDLR